MCESAQEAKKECPEKYQLPAPPKDPWMHRHQGMLCRTCMWFVEKVKRGLAVSHSPVVGRCRRHSPSMNGYPVVYENDWCGDHKIDENK